MSKIETDSVFWSRRKSRPSRCAHQGVEIGLGVVVDDNGDFLLERATPATLSSDLFTLKAQAAQIMFSTAKVMVVGCGRRD